MFIYRGAVKLSHISKIIRGLRELREAIDRNHIDKDGILRILGEIIDIGEKEEKQEPCTCVVIDELEKTVTLNQDYGSTRHNYYFCDNCRIAGETRNPNCKCRKDRICTCVYAKTGDNSNNVLPDSSKTHDLSIDHNERWELAE